MDDLKKLSVERLRDLARRHLGKGHSRLRTKAQLLEGLKGVLKDTLHRLEEAAESVVKSGVKVVDFPPGRRGRVRDHAAPPPAEAAPTETTRPTATPVERREAAAGKGGAGTRESAAPASRAPSGRNGANARRGARPPPLATEELGPTAEPERPHSATVPGAGARAARAETAPPPLPR